MPHALDVGKKRLRALVARAPIAAPALPLVHTTDAYAFEEVIDTGRLIPQPCPVFTGEALTYFFYGRPAFRPNLQEEPTGLKHYLPICLIFRPDWTTAIKRVFPFDSGAFQNGFYAAYLHSKMRLGDFSLEPDPNTPGKVISRFFGGIPAYLAAAPTSVTKPDPSEFEAESYLAMIHAREGNAVDSRGSGVEVQVDQEVSIKDALAAVVLPTSFAQGQTGAALKTLGIDPLPYRTYERFRPNEYMSELTTIVLNYYAKIGLVSEADL